MNQNSLWEHIPILSTIAGAFGSGLGIGYYIGSNAAKAEIEILKQTNVQLTEKISDQKA